MDTEQEYGVRLQNIIDSLIASGADKFLGEGDEIVLRFGDESVVVSRLRGRLSVRVLDVSTSGRGGPQSDVADC